ncbi:MAG: ROK family protein [Alistipes sp.]
MKKYAIGIDLGGTMVKYAVVDSEGQPVFNGQGPTCAQEGVAVVMAQIRKGISACMEYAQSVEEPLEGIGIGTPGVVSADHRTVIGGAENISGWENIPLAYELEVACGLPVLINNDASLMALGETLYGAAKGATDVVFVTVGTGIGGGVLIDGKLYSGYKNHGMELGHITIKADGETCVCGGIGCLEHYASTVALVRRFCALSQVDEHSASDLNGKDVVFFYKEGNPMAICAMEEHWTYLAYGVANMINLFAPQKVVIGGGISEAGAFYLDKLREKVFRQAMAVCSAETQLVGAELGNKAGCLGAAGMIFQNSKL